MKILESQSAVLTNLEVYQFLQNQDKEYRVQKRKETLYQQALREEVIAYFESKPGPMCQQPLPFDVTTAIPKLLERLRPYNIAKGEMIMILNTRPTNEVSLNTVIENVGERFNEEQQQDIINGIIEVLGKFDPSQDEMEVDHE